MKQVFLYLTLLLFSFNLQAQCADFTLVSVDCQPGGVSVFELSAELPPDWFGEIHTYFIDGVSGDTLLTDPISISGGNVLLTTDVQEGIYQIVLDLDGLCQEVLAIALPFDCGYNAESSAEISGKVWFDANQDGLRQAGEGPVPAVVSLEIPGAVFAQTTTDLAGNYVFRFPPDLDNYAISFEPTTDDLLFPTLYQVGEDSTIDSDMFGSFIAEVIFADGNVVARNIDAGFRACDLSVTLDDTVVDCNAGCSGILSPTISGGTGPYSFAWSNGATTQTIENLCTRDFTVTVTDATGCVAEATATVIEGSDIAVAMNVAAPTCAPGCDGILTPTITGGVPPYTYEWRSGGVISTEPQLINVCEGIYFLAVADATGCAVEFEYHIQSVPSFVVTASVMDATCFGTCDGSIDLTVAGGSGNLNYIWNNGAIGPSITGLCAGEYVVVIDDSASGCSQTFSYTILEPAEIVSVVTTNADVCGTSCTGTAVISTTGGTPPYIYTWGANSGDNDPVLEDLCPGNYQVTINDANGCSGITDFVIEETGLIAVVDRMGGDCDPDGGNFSAQVVATGGTAPYNYTWSDGTEGSAFPIGDPLASHSVTITDQSGCSTVLSEITAGAINLINLGPAFNVSACNDLENVLEPFILSLGGVDQVVLPNGDTLMYPAAVGSLSSGDYEYISTSPNRHCQEVVSFALDVLEVPDDIEILHQLPAGCGDYGCLEITGSFLPGTVAAGLDIVVVGPDGYVATPRDPLPYLACELPGPGEYTVIINDGCIPLEITYTVTPITDCGEVSGTLFSTADASCTPGPGDIPIPFTIIELQEQGTGQSFFTITNEEGMYSMSLPPGTYQAIPIVNGQAPDGACSDVLFTLTGDIAVVADVYAPAAVFCPQMDLDIFMPQQRRCFENSMSIYYYNQGNVAAEDVVLTVELDPFYTDITADVPFTQVDNVLFFDLGTVPYCGFGWIQINFTISCDADLGQTHCVNANITPSGFCDPDPVWNGSLINVTDAVCDGDSVRFTLSNVGTSPLSQPLSYVVVEDGIMMSAQPIVTTILAPSEIFEVAVLANGSVFQIVATQEPGAPVVNPPSLLVQGCGENPSTGFTNILPLGNGLPWMETVCLENTGSWDPNDKRGFPLGHTGDMIAPGTRIDYNIRFQNTGTDTAFTVVIRDTIGPALDLKTFRVGAASHPFELSIDTNRVLTFTFDDILLPDSTTNPVGSQGGVSFTIDHDSSLEPGDLIENQAAIFFDFNEPIITNVSTHMIELQGLPTGLRPVLANRVTIEVYPNPATDWLRVNVPDDEVRPGEALVISDVFGREVQRQPVIMASSEIRLQELPAGIYVLNLVNRVGQVRGRANFVVLD